MKGLYFSVRPTEDLDVLSVRVSVDIREQNHLDGLIKFYKSAKGVKDIEKGNTINCDDFSDDGKVILILNKLFTMAKEMQTCQIDRHGGFVELRIKIKKEIFKKNEDPTKKGFKFLPEYFCFLSDKGLEKRRDVIIIMDTVDTEKKFGYVLSILQKVLEELKKEFFKIEMFESAGQKLYYL